MAWRFKASKYKNAVPVVPKPENCIRDITIGSYQTYGNNIISSAAFMAFNTGQNGSSLAVLPLDDSGRKGKDMALLHAHTDTVTDMSFSPFHDGLLATGSQDCLIKVWHIPKLGLESSLSDPECVLYSKMQRRVETVLFHPVADCLLSTTSYTALNLWDLTTQQAFYNNTDDHTEVIQCICWNDTGSLIATTCKDKQLRILDCRKDGAVVNETISHQGIKDSRTVWLNDGFRLLTTGFSGAREREICIRDLRKFDSPQKSIELDSSTGILLPLYDPDTNMLFLAGKGDTSIFYMEVTNREPFLIEGLRHNGEQTKGACLVPKRALNVMQGEVNRVLQLTSSMVIPIMYQVPRKTYRDFHSDLFPDTTGCTTDLSAGEWFSGKNSVLSKISLDPSKKTAESGPRLGPKPFTPPKLQTYSSLDKPTSVEPNNFDKVFSVPCVSQNVEKISSAMTENYSEVTSTCDLEKLSTYDTEINDFSKCTENSKIYEKNSFDLDKVCNKTNERNLGYGDVCEKIENSFDKPLKKVPNMEENVDKFKRKSNESPVKNGEVTHDESFLPKTPSMAERRKLFEVGRGSTTVEEKEIPDGMCASKSAENLKEEQVLERGSAQRSSIAERRKVYENRTTSVQEQSVTVDKTSPTPLRRRSSFKSKQEEVVEEPVNRRVTLGGPIRSSEKSSERKETMTPTPKRTSTVFGRVSKFRHLKGTPTHKSTFIENIRNVSRQVTGECDGFHANSERVAVPLSGPGGKIAVFELCKTGRLPDVVTPTLVHGTTVMDFCWDPFDNRKLAVACDDGVVRLWTIPITGLTEPTNKPDAVLTCHSDKIYCTKFHPLAKDVLVTASYDMTIKLWDLNEMREKICLTGHTDQIFCMAWSPCGKFLATACKDMVLRLYNPRQCLQPIRSGKGPVGTRGARIVWALDGAYLVVLGFDKVSERQIMVFKSNELSQPLTTVGLDVSPAILMPFYDEDSSTLFLTGRGDSTIYTFEVTEENPYVCPLSHHRCGSLHQGLSFLSKKDCDVASVEFAKALRLSNNTIEPLSFTVPRIKSELFQDDLFPPTKVTWEPTVTSSEWFAGANKQARRISLKPDNMESLSSVSSAEKPSAKPPSPLNINSHYNKFNPELQEYGRSKQEQIQKSVSSKMEVNLSLEQDHMEGVDEHEWDE
ncbi:UNVERIFIED_CONTAM: hypothetical protein PYX00_010761 [Menopon gallinae]|uniref:Coronin n=1 Tax=Menopon gallinae TaxID=328185 RepID=A0AAW2HHE5_9NEOP